MRNFLKHIAFLKLRGIKKQGLKANFNTTFDLWILEAERNRKLMAEIAGLNFIISQQELVIAQQAKIGNAQQKSITLLIDEKVSLCQSVEELKKRIAKQEENTP